MSVNTLKCVNCNIVICELLSFIQNKIDVMDNDSLIRICDMAFTVDEVECAKELLFSSIKTNKKKVKRRKQRKKVKELEDIICVFKVTEPDLRPIFVARDLQKLPPVTFDHVDVTKLFKDLLIMRAEIDDMKSKYVTVTQLDELKLELRRPIMPLYENDESMTRRESMERSESPEYLIAPTPINSTLLENKMDTEISESAVCIPGLSQLKRPTMAEMASKGEWKQPKKPTDDWILVQKRRSRNRFTGKMGKAAMGASEKFRAADVKIPVFNSNVNKGVAVYDILYKWEIDPSELVLLEELGAGQFGVVRRGKWRGRIDTAVKMMKEGTMSEDDFIDEAKVMTKLQHQNLVQLYGVCSKHRPIYIVTEYMRHGSLFNYLRRTSPDQLGPAVLLDMCIQVCKGMAYLERHNYIHRDLAARNCLVGDENVVKVADFGLARYVLDDQYTSSGGTKFPIKWAPPEVLNYTRFSSKSDVWAFGVLMWEVFTCGKVPYGRMKNSEVADMVQRGMLLEKPKGCLNEIYNVMRMCWRRSPEERPSFRVLKEELGVIAHSVLAD